MNETIAMANEIIRTPIDRSYDSLATINFSPYEDEFIAIINGMEVGHDKDERVLVRDIKMKHPGKLPFIVKVPDRSMVPYI